MDYGVPSSTELLEAVREFLRTEAAPALPDGLRFHALVAAHVLGIVQRELAAPPEPAEEHDRGLAALGFADDAALARALAAGEPVGPEEAVHALLLRAAVARLRVVNPAYEEAGDGSGDGNRNDDTEADTSDH